MKNLVYLLMAIGLIIFGSCEPNRDRATADEDVLNERRDDTRAAPGDTLDQPERQTPAGGEDLREGDIPDVNEGERAKGHAMEGIPSQIREKLSEDAAEKDRKVLNSRPITYGDVNHYELTYLEKDGNQTKITYNEKGEKINESE